MLNSVGERTPPCGTQVLNCVGFASLDVVCDELNDCVWRFVCSSCLISVCMFILSKALLISSATVIVSAGGSHLVEPLCYGII